MSIEDNKVRCGHLCWQGTADQLIPVTMVNDLTGEPINKTLVCPYCHDDDDLTHVCDEPGCWAEATCGWPCEVYRYRNTCHEHSKWARDRALEQRGDCDLTQRRSRPL